MAEEQNIIKTTIDLPENLHQRIKMLGVKKKITMKDLIILGLYNFIEEAENEKEIDDSELLAENNKK
jgi:hypothetical protein